MCVIIIKPRNIQMPSREELLMASYIHPDGFGFVSESDSFKSLSFEAFYKRLSKVPQSENCIIHLRYATHGSVKKANCHPFYGDGVWFAHNGCLPFYPEGDITDSEYAFRNVLLPAIREHGIRSEETDAAVGRIIGWSKFAMMVDGELHLFGNFTKYKGRLYSNTRHLPYTSIGSARSSLYDSRRVV